MSSMLKGGAAFVAEIKKAKMSISPKSTLICNDLETGKLLVRALGRLGVRLQLSCEADHLGHERTTASNRTSASLNKRFAKAKKRANRASWPARKTPKARGLFKTGIMPQAKYGSEILGLSPQLQEQPDSMAKSIAAPGGFGTCKVTARAGRISTIS